MSGSFCYVGVVSSARELSQEVGEFRILPGPEDSFCASILECRNVAFVPEVPWRRHTDNHGAGTARRASTHCGVLEDEHSRLVDHYLFRSYGGLYSAEGVLEGDYPRGLFPHLQGRHDVRIRKWFQPFHIALENDVVRWEP